METVDNFIRRMEVRVARYQTFAMTDSVLQSIRSQILSEIHNSSIVFQDKRIKDVLVSFDTEQRRVVLNYLCEKYDPEKPLNLFKERLTVLPELQPVIARERRLSGKPKKPDKIDKARAYKKEWRETMTELEVEFCEAAIRREVIRIKAYHIGDFRAARMWVSSQRRRFSRDREATMETCAQHDFIFTRWNWRKFRSDIYLLGFDYDC